MKPEEIAGAAFNLGRMTADLPGDQLAAMLRDVAEGRLTFFADKMPELAALAEATGDSAWIDCAQANIAGEREVARMLVGPLEQVRQVMRNLDQDGGDTWL